MGYLVVASALQSQKRIRNVHQSRFELSKPSRRLPVYWLEFQPSESRIRDEENWGLRFECSRCIAIRKPWGNPFSAGMCCLLAVMVNTSQEKYAA
jgi:hypothetical protein